MLDYVKISIKCPTCKNTLEKSHYASRGRCTTWWRIKCTSKGCKIDTGMQATMSDAYEAFMCLFLGAESDRKYIQDIPESSGEASED